MTVCANSGPFIDGLTNGSKRPAVTAVELPESAGARAGADDPGPSKGHMLASSDCPHGMHEAAGRKRNGEAIRARTFGDIVGSFPDLVRPAPPCAYKRPVIPRIGHNPGGDGDSRSGSHSRG